MVRFWITLLKRLRTPEHEDNRRVLWAVTLQSREYVFIVWKQTADLGNHYHNYTEQWTLLWGQAKARFRQPEQSGCDEYKLRLGSAVTIVPGMAHVIRGDAGCVLLIRRPAGQYSATALNVW
ncbi:MAG: hypothetical protein HY565_00920 [Candidatus Kerfeldbacteria bacterium]|nr:hypothetical protein [Candidatus Kerfeldbacteria bacterium]